MIYRITLYKMSEMNRKSCMICDEDTTNNSLLLHKTRRYKHQLCQDCYPLYIMPFLEQYIDNLRKNIRTDDMLYIRCPGCYHGQHRNHCTKTIDIRTFKVPKDSNIAKYIFIIWYVLSNPFVCLCPNRKCKNIVSIFSDDSDVSCSKTICQECKHVWCRNCMTQPYHDDMNCIEYEASQNNTENGKYIWQMKTEGILKFCPQCKTATVKNNGCNKMVCSICRLKWCWLCQTTNIDYDHYNPTKETSCSNKLWEGIDINK